VSGLEKFVARFHAMIKPVSSVANSVGMALIAAIMFLTALDVILRKTLNTPIMGAYELTQFMMATALGLSMAHCGLEKGHVTVDVLINLFSRRVQGMIGCIIGLMGVVMAVLMTWQMVVYIQMVHQSNKVSAVLLIPVYPFVTVVTIGIALYAVILFLHFCEFLSGALKK